MFINTKQSYEYKRSKLEADIEWATSVVTHYLFIGSVIETMVDVITCLGGI